MAITKAHERDPKKLLISLLDPFGPWTLRLFVMRLRKMGLADYPHSGQCMSCDKWDDVELEAVETWVASL